MSDTTDYSKHSDEQLEEGIRKATQNESRIAEEDSEEALAAAREQRDAMQRELDSRRS